MGTIVLEPEIERHEYRIDVGEKTYLSGLGVHIGLGTLERMIRDAVRIGATDISFYIERIDGKYTNRLILTPSKYCMESDEDYQKRAERITKEREFYRQRREQRDREEYEKLKAKFEKQ